MDILNNFVLPQSSHHMVLLKYILALTFILFIPYMSLLFGTITLSLYFKRKSIASNNTDFYRLSKELIDLVTFNKGIAVALGLIPLISSSFCYAQLLYSTGLLVSEYILISALILFVSLIFIYVYKHTLHLNEIFEFASHQNLNELKILEEVKRYGIKTSKLMNSSGYLGWFLLIISTYFFISAVQFSSEPDRWEKYNNFFGILFSFNALINYVQFVFLSFAFTSAFILYKLHSSSSFSTNESYNFFVKNISLRLGLISTIVLPAIIVLSIFTKSNLSLSYNVFSFTVLALLFMLLISILFYIMIKENNTKFSIHLVFLFVAAISFIIIKDQSAFGTSTKKQFVTLASNYEEYQKKLKEQFGLIKETISGSDIFNSKCIACHQFDRRVVGPPYNEVLPKYEGKKQELIKFIMNPVKINPDYPAMPNQGLKPNEAEAVADFIMNTYKKK